MIAPKADSYSTRNKWRPQLADALKNEYDEAQEQLWGRLPPLSDDLLNAALSEVDWHQSRNPSL
jgi:hypothetical protein